MLTFLTVVILNCVDAKGKHFNIKKEKELDIKLDHFIGMIYLSKLLYIN